MKKKCGARVRTELASCCYHDSSAVNVEVPTLAPFVACVQPNELVVETEVHQPVLEAYCQRRRFLLHHHHGQSIRDCPRVSAALSLKGAKKSILVYCTSLFVSLAPRSSLLTPGMMFPESFD